MNVATPYARAAAPSAFVPSLNVTVPAGAPALDVTVAVKVTEYPAVLGLGAAVSVVAVAAGAIVPFTTSVAFCAGLPLSVAKIV